MSLPRYIVPGFTYLLTRRCFGRQFLLRPSRKVNQIFEFCLAVAAARSGCEVHAYYVLSDHYHVVVTDVDGKLPVFMHWLNEYVAKCVNRLLGRWESFWAPGSYSQVCLVDEEDVMSKLVYTYTNPVSAGLVSSYRQWPGAGSTPEAMAGQERVIERPKGFFREKGPVPASMPLKLTLPPAWSGRSDWLAELEARITARQIEIRAAFNKKGRHFLGRRGVLKQSPFSRPGGAAPRRGLNPRVAARDKGRRIQSLQRLKRFVCDYREAWRRFSRGERSVLFPFGTYGMRVHLQVMCSGP